MTLSVWAYKCWADRVTDWILPTAHDNPEERQEEKSTNIRESKRRKKKRLILIQRSLTYPSFQWQHSLSLMCRWKYVQSRKGNPEGKKKELNPHKQLPLHISKHWLGLDDPARNYSIFQAWQHTTAALKIMFILSYMKAKNTTRSDSEENKPPVFSNSYLQ